MSDLLKLGNEITYDVDSLDIWLDMRVECIEIGLVINFEIKIEKRTTCGVLKCSLLDIVNQILKAKNVPLLYEENDIKLIKAAYEKQLTIGKDSATTERKSIPKKVSEISDSSKICNNFDYLERFIICVITKENSDQCKETLKRRVTINTNTSNIVTDIFDTVKDAMPCRGIKIDKYNFPKTHEVNNSENNEKDVIKSNCCKCILF